jgi:thiamine kinase-like enzyme
MERVGSQQARWIPPERDELAITLTSLLSSTASLDGPLTIVRREPVVQGSYPKEIVTCHLDDGRTLRVLCKYAAEYDHRAHGHRGGVAHEAVVYQRLLQPLELVTPKLYGVHTDAARGGVWLVVEYLENSMYVSRAVEPEAIGLAARWIGQFHAASQQRLKTTIMPFLKPYDEDYYLGWAQRAWQYLDICHHHTPWLEQICRSYNEAVTSLLSVPPVVVHGEYYPRNVLWCDGTIYPVDWESTRLAAGEIDLASLVERWPEEIVQECEGQYQAARWPEGTPEGFQRRLWAARLYLNFRWLSDRPATSDIKWRLEALQVAGQHLGLV